MIGFIDKWCSAIATTEGFFVKGSLPVLDNNPGDLRGAPWLTHPIVTNGFWHAATMGQGIAGLFHQAALDIARGWTARQFIYSWAPPTDNNATENYLKEMCRRVGIPYYPLVNNKPDPAEPPLEIYLELTELP